MYSYMLIVIIVCNMFYNSSRELNRNLNHTSAVANTNPNTSIYVHAPLTKKRSLQEDVYISNNTTNNTNYEVTIKSAKLLHNTNELYSEAVC